MSGHPAIDLDETVHQRVRLGILAVLGEVSQCAFGVLRDELELTDGNLSRHLQVLETAGLLAITKGFQGKRPATWVQLTPAGKEALRKELETLEQLAARLRKGDPYKDDFRRWVPDMPELPVGANALFKARSKAVAESDEHDIAELRDELAKLGVVVRDEKKRQYFRLV